MRGGGRDVRGGGGVSEPVMVAVSSLSREGPRLFRPECRERWETVGGWYLPGE